MQELVSWAHISLMRFVMQTTDAKLSHPLNMLFYYSPAYKTMFVFNRLAIVFALQASRHKTVFPTSRVSALCRYKVPFLKMNQVSCLDERDLLHRALRKSYFALFINHFRALKINNS